MTRTGTLVANFVVATLNALITVVAVLAAAQGSSLNLGLVSLTVGVAISLIAAAAMRVASFSGPTVAALAGGLVAAIGVAYSGPAPRSASSGPSGVWTRWLPMTRGPSSSVSKPECNR